MYFNQSALHARQVFIRVQSESSIIIAVAEDDALGVISASAMRSIFILSGEALGDALLPIGKPRRFCFLVYPCPSMFERLLVVEGAHKRGSKSTPTFATECENYRGLQCLGEEIVREVVAGAAKCPKRSDGRSAKTTHSFRVP